ncbi:MAG TPA: FAD-dependent oxidoreductase [Steroidobacteraceae bacterium]|nr:FAD-dependent oxidoreductase [Steroidobacteraceae bacterium]
MATAFPRLFAPLQIRGCTLKNRIMSTGHDTTLPVDGTVNEALVAYQEARARGGAGLIILQVSGVHETARYTNHVLMATDDSAIAGYRRVAEAVHRFDTVLFAQLFHPGREIAEADGGLLSVAYAPSCVPNERFHVMPRPLKIPMIRAIVNGYGDAARRMQSAGLDGVEIVASHGYLPAQFLNPRVNLREDGYGGDLEGRLRFLREVIADIRGKVNERFVVGLRISGTEGDENGLSQEESLQSIMRVADSIDYVNITLGNSASLGGAIHIAPPMSMRTSYVAPYASSVKQRVDIPVFVAGRINQPQDAEAILVSGQADVCGMTRALICDPELPNKASRGAADDIRACIACNQACIGHFHKGYPISCIQNPVSGRELRFGALSPTTVPRKVMVVGGGPAGMKAAVVAAQRGHSVTLFEAQKRLGGQALLAQLLPGRAEFGGLVTNLLHELSASGVAVRTGTSVDRAMVVNESPDVVVMATGATPYRPEFSSEGALQIADAWQILQETVEPGHSVVVIDWRADWIGIGIAERLAQRGCSVRLAVSGIAVGETLPLYVRDASVASLHKLGVTILPYMRLYGSDSDSVYLQHITSGEAVVLDSVDTLVLCTGHVPVTDLADAIEDLSLDLRIIGDAASPRTAEEAVFEGLRAGAEI